MRRRRSAMSWPVIAAAAGDSRKATSAAISAGWISRPIGGRRGALRGARRISSIAVSVAAGDTTLTVTPCGAHLARPAARQRDERRLGRGVLAAPRHALRDAAADQHDATAAALRHRRHERVGEARWRHRRAGATSARRPS